MTPVTSLPTPVMPLPSYDSQGMSQGHNSGKEPHTAKDSVFLVSFFSWRASTAGSSNSLRRSQFGAGGGGGGYTPKRTPSLAALNFHQQSTQLPDSMLVDVDAAGPPPPVLAAQLRQKEQEAAEMKETQQWRAQTEAVLQDVNKKLELVIVRLEQPLAQQPPPPPPPAPVVVTPAPEAEEERKNAALAAQAQMDYISKQLRRMRRETKRFKMAVMEQPAPIVMAPPPPPSPLPTPQHSEAHTQFNVEQFADTIQQNVEDIVGRAERKTQTRLADMEARLLEVLRKTNAASSSIVAAHKSPRNQSSTALLRPSPTPLSIPSPFALPQRQAPRASAPPTPSTGGERKRKTRASATAGTSSQADVARFRKDLFRQLLREK